MEAAIHTFTSFWKRRPYAAPAALAVAAAALTAAVALLADLPVRDPDGIFGPRSTLLVGAVVALVAVDIVPRGIARAVSRRLGLWSALTAVTRERWSGRRFLLIVTGILSFYVTYVAYRNLKSFLPLVRDQDLDLDVSLMSAEQGLFGGESPTRLLQDLLGTGLAADVLSVVYLFFLAFVPISLSAALVWSSDLRAGFWYVMALGVNWLLGVASYYLLPALGPVFVAPELVHPVADTGVVDLQYTLVESREAVLRDPWATPEVQSIAAFASLHVAIVFTAALIAQLLRVPKALRIALWTFLALTLVATVYFGWHYLIDNVAGLAMGAAAVWLSALATGRARLRRRQVSASPA